MSKYLRNQCKTTPCDIILQVLDAHSQAEKKKDLYYSLKSVLPQR